jgi:predicted nucleic acid-binding protein
MMTKLQRPRIYFDASAFIAFFGNEACRAPICRSIIQDARDGKIDLFISQCTIIECKSPVPDFSGLNGEGNAPDRVGEFFEHDFIIKCDVDRWVAREARRIQQAAPRKIKPMDATHLATAIVYKADWFFTYDDDHLTPLSQHRVVSGLEISHPSRPWAPQRTMDELDGVIEPQTSGITIVRKNLDVTS